MLRKVYFLFGQQNKKASLVKNILKLYREYELKCTLVVDYDVAKSPTLKSNLNGKYDAVVVDPVTSSNRSISEAMRIVNENGFATVSVFCDKIENTFPNADHTLLMTSFDPNIILGLGKKKKIKPKEQEQIERKEQKEKQVEIEDDEE